MESTKVLIQGQPVESSQATISIFDHGFLYGDMVYEVIRSQTGKPFLLSPHLRRLHYSAERIGLEIPWPDDLFRAEFCQLAANFDQEVQVRIVVTKGAGPLVPEPFCGSPARIMIARPLPPIPAKWLEQGVYLTIWAEASGTPSLGHIKSPRMGKGPSMSQLSDRGFQEMVRVNADGLVTEGRTSNLFWVTDGIVYTPSLETGILKGITRQLVLALACEGEITVVEGTFFLDHLLGSDEVFICGTSKGILPVSRIDDHHFNKGPMTSTLMKAIASCEDQDLSFLT